MKCKNCDGNGGYFYMNRWCFCEQCDGTGQDGLSNNEWRKTCSTKEFAEWMFDVIEFCLNYEIIITLKVLGGIKYIQIKINIKC